MALRIPKSFTSRRIQICLTQPRSLTEFKKNRSLKISEKEGEISNDIIVHASTVEF